MTRRRHDRVRSRRDGRPPPLERAPAVGLPLHRRGRARRPRRLRRARPVRGVLLLRPLRALPARCDHEPERGGRRRDRLGEVLASEDLPLPRGRRLRPPRLGDRPQGRVRVALRGARDAADSPLARRSRAPESALRALVRGGAARGAPRRLRGGALARAHARGAGGAARGAARGLRHGRRADAARGRRGASRALGDGGGSASRDSIRACAGGARGGARARCPLRGRAGRDVRRRDERGPRPAGPPGRARPLGDVRGAGARDPDGVRDGGAARADRR